MLTKADRKREIEDIKERWSKPIEDYSNGIGNRPHFIGKDTPPHYDYCFATTFRKVRDKRAFNRVRMLLYFDRKMDIFDYDAIFKEVNKIFGGYLKFIRYFSGKRNIRIIEAHLKKEFGSATVHWVALYLGYIIIRCMDRQFDEIWRHIPKKINNVRDLLYYFNKHVESTKYCTNETIRAHRVRGNFNKMRETINKVVNTLEDAFSSGNRKINVGAFPGMNLTEGHYQTSVLEWLEDSIQ